MSLFVIMIYIDLINIDDGTQGGVLSDVLHDVEVNFFIPVAIETSGVFGPKTTEFLKELGLRLRQVSGEANSFAYLTQRLSVAIQRGHAASVLGTIKMDSEEEEFLV